MKAMFSVVRIAFLSLLLVGLGVGCGKTAKVDVDEQVLNKVITDYLQGNSMDLKVVEFKSLEMDEAQNLVAKASLTQADGMVGVNVRWTFWLKKTDGKWSVLKYKQ
jgi:hypothetical protein